MFMHKTLAFLASRVLMVIGSSAQATVLFNESFKKSSGSLVNRDRKLSRGPLLPHHRAHRSLIQRPGELSQRV